MFSHVVSSPRSKCQKDWFLVKPIFLVCKWPPLLVFSPWLSLCAQKEISDISFSCYKIISPVTLGPCSYNFTNFNYFLKDQNITTLVARASTYKFGPEDILSITLGKSIRVEVQYIFLCLEKHYLQKSVSWHIGCLSSGRNGGEGWTNVLCLQ